MEHPSGPDLIGDVLDGYGPALSLLDEYDHGTLETPPGTVPLYAVDYDDARALIDALALRFPNDALLGIERGETLRGILGTVEQSFGGQALYASSQEKAAHLLYFIVKDHPLSDGNKRTAAALFVYYLLRNSAMHDRSDVELISNNALAAITLVIAMSNPNEKETMIRLVTSMLSTTLQERT
jgi:prophage maintenance system killer protein